MLLKKNYPGEMLIEQIIEFELRGAWLPGRTCAPRLVILMTKQKSQRKIFEWIIIYSKNIAGGNVPYFSYLDQITNKI